MRIVGLETEFALGFHPSSPTSLRPSQNDLFQALLSVLKASSPSLEAAYYKGGDFLSNGSLIHFEVSQLDDSSVGLLEWATPECLGSLEAAIYVKAQEQALAKAVAEAQANLSDQGFSGRLFLLKNNEDRYGNAYGCHESYDVREQPLDWGGRLCAYLLHPLMLCLLATLGLALALPLLGLLCAVGIVFLPCQMVAAIPGLRRPGEWLRRQISKALEYLVEPSPTPGSGLVARASLLFLRVGGVLFSWTASRVLFRGHLSALLPFLVTRPVFAGAGSLGPDGRYVLTPRAKLMRSVVGAFIYGRARPMIDIKEFFYRRPLSYLSARKRLHTLAGDANRSEYTEVLKLATTELVLDAIEAGALDELRRLQLIDGPLAAFRRVAADPSLKSPIALDPQSGELLTALDIQRRTLEAVWRHCQSLPEVDPESKDALVRWNFVLDRLADDPRTLDRELDWVIKLKLLQQALRESLPELKDPWIALAAWGPINAEIEAKAPHLELGLASTSDAAQRALRSSLGPLAFRRACRHVRANNLDWGSLAPVRHAYLRLKTIDLKYHEISTDGGYYDWLCRDGAVARILDPERVANADSEAPQGTRAQVRAQVIRRYAGQEDQRVRVGWDTLVFEVEHGESRVVRIDDPYDATPAPGLLPQETED